MSKQLTQCRPAVDWRTRGPRLFGWWARHQPLLAWLVAGALALFAAHRLANDFWRLIVDSGPWGAVDLVNCFHPWVQGWFAGDPTAATWPNLVYPPASYALLWPLLGWLPLGTARWLWAAATIGALVWLIVLVSRETRASTPWQRAFVALLVLAPNATGHALGNGQVTLFVLPPLVAALVLLRDGAPTWRTDLLASGLLVLALLKPSLSVPFFWIVLFAPGRLRPLLLAASGYAGLTWLAVPFQEASTWTLLQTWLASGSSWAPNEGYADLPRWLGVVGLSDWALVGALVLLLFFGIWTFYYRYADLWLLMGVAALVAWVWTYHRAYDDVLVLIPAVALLRLAGPAADSHRDTRLARALLAALVIAMVLPTRLIFEQPAPWPELFAVGQTLLRGIVLAFLLWQTARLSRRAPGGGGAPGNLASAHYGEAAPRVRLAPG